MGTAVTERIRRIRHLRHHHIGGAPLGAEGTETVRQDRSDHSPDGASCQVCQCEEEHGHPTGGG